MRLAGIPGNAITTPARLGPAADLVPRHDEPGPADPGATPAPRPAIALILDRDAEARDSLCAVLGMAFPGVRTIPLAAVVQAKDQCAHLQAVALPPDIALVDPVSPDEDVFAFIRALHGSAPNCLCVVVSTVDDDRHLLCALRAGAAGYLLKQHSPSELARRLRAIVDGEPPLSPTVLRRLLALFAPAPVDEQSPLTGREREVLGLIAKGLTLNQVATALAITRHTAAGYVKNVYRKLGVASRAEATHQALRLGLVEYMDKEPAP